MKTTILKLAAILLLVGMVSCGKDDETRLSSGTIIGSFTNGFCSILVQVDDEYPIGNSLDYTVEGLGLLLPETGVYKNLIQVQADEGYHQGDKISFSYRTFNPNNTDDSKLFICGSGLIHGNSVPPEVPIFIIVDYIILK
jgi:hypothetical protein